MRVLSPASPNDTLQVTTPAAAEERRGGYHGVLKSDRAAGDPNNYRDQQQHPHITNMNTFKKSLEIRWSDLDPNFHVLHSRYYDFGAYCRMAFFVEHGLTPALMAQHAIGPILFREECIFKREISFGDQVEIAFKLTSHTDDYSRWSISHEIWKNGDTLSALIHVDGAWMDTVRRKLTVPPKEMHAVFQKAPR